MMEHHTLIEVLLALFKDNKSSDLKMILGDFNKFRWELEKHFFVEEKAIFKFRHPKFLTLINEFMEEHRNMVGALDKIEGDLTAGKEADISDFYKSLVEHRNKEENDLYSKIDEEFDETRKEEIIRRINEIPVSNN